MNRVDRFYAWLFRQPRALAANVALGIGLLVLIHVVQFINGELTRTGLNARSIDRMLDHPLGHRVHIEPEAYAGSSSNGGDLKIEPGSAVNALWLGGDITPTSTNFSMLRDQGNYIYVLPGGPPVSFPHTPGDACMNGCFSLTQEAIASCGYGTSRCTDEALIHGIECSRACKRQKTKVIW